MSGRDILLGLVIVVIWGLNFIAIKVGLADIPPLLLGALRFLAATFPAIFFLPRPPIAWRWLISLGLTINVGQFSLLFLGMKVGMPAGLASLVLQAQVFFTLAISVMLFGESWSWNSALGLILAACGMTVIGLQQDANIVFLGFGFTIAAAASWGAGNIIMRRATQGVPPFSMLSLVVWAGAVAILPLLLLSWYIEGPAVWKEALQAPTWSTIASVAYLAYLATLGGYVLWGRLLSRYPAAIVSPFALLVPIIGMSSSSLLLGELLSVAQKVGALLVMSGLIIHIFGEKLRLKMGLGID